MMRNFTLLILMIAAFTGCVPSPADKDAPVQPMHGDHSEPAEKPKENADYSQQIAQARDLNERLYELVEKTRAEEMDMAAFAKEAKPLQDSLSLILKSVPPSVKATIDAHRKSLFNSAEE